MTRAWGGALLGGGALAWLGGVALQLQQATLSRPATYATAVAVGLAALLAARRRPSLALLAAALLGFGVTGWHAQTRLADALSPGLEGRDVVLTGVVASLPRSLPDGARFVFDVEAATLGGVPVDVPRRVSLGWYVGWHDEAWLAGPPPALAAGERWRFTARLKLPHGSVNPHGFDHELWLFEQGIRATGTVRSGAGAVAQRLDVGAGARVERLRQRLVEAIALRVGEPRAAGVLAALAVGDQAAIERTDWDLFRATGVAHLMAISGLHVTMFAWLAGGLVSLAWRRSARLALALPTPLAARWGGLAAAAAYALLAGWGVPAQRTVWMLATAALLATLGVRWPWPLVLAAAGVVVTALDPWALLQPGFWLSFVAVGLLLVAEPQAPREPPRGPRARLIAAVRGGVRTQAVATLGLAPLTLVFFQQLSVVGFVANLLAIPLVTLLITPLALGGVLLAPLWDAGAVVLGALVAALGWLAAWPGAVWTAAAAPWWAQLAGLAGGALLVAPLPWRLRGCAVALVLPLLAPPTTRPAAGTFELIAADVGQGTAVLVRTASRVLVYDAGPQYSRDTDAGQRVVLPLLRALGARRIDALVLSHRDVDHVGGAAALLAALPVTRVTGSLDESHPLRATGLPFEPCSAGDGWRWDGVRFDVLHPPRFDPAAKPNTMSCVLRIEDTHGRRALLAGDIEAAQELALVAADRAALAADVLLVPHHGSRTSSSEVLVAAVAPQVAVVQAGYRNRFGHPAPAVVQRYGARGIALVDTASCGAWTWREGASHCERERGARYWRQRPPPAALGVVPGPARAAAAKESAP